MKIAVVGAGRMGSWLAQLLRNDHQVAVLDKDRNKAKTVPADRHLSKLDGLEGFSPDILINAVDLAHTVEVFQEAIQYVPKKCVLVDVTSVKGALREFYSSCDHKYVSIHPMFGPTFGDMEALEGESVVFIHGSDPRTEQMLKTYFDDIGLTFYHFGFEEHDRMMAYSLTTPFVASLTFAACLESDAVLGTTFTKHKAIAKGLLAEDDALLTEILFNPKSVEQLNKVTGKLEFLKHVIDGRDAEEASRFLQDLRDNVG